MMNKHLRRWSTKNLIKLKQAVEASIVQFQNETPSSATERLVFDTLLRDRSVTLTEVDTLLAERKSVE